MESSILKQKKGDNYIIFGHESDEINENYKLFNFWLKKIYKERDRNENIQDNRMALYDFS